MLKRLWLLTLTVFLLTAPCQASQPAYEWESDNAVSYSIGQHKSSSFLQVVMTNYAKRDGTNEYWMKLFTNWSGYKILHWSSLVIDGTEYKLTAVENPSEKYHLAGSSTYEEHYRTRTPPRYFVLSNEIVSKLLAAKEVHVIYNTNEWESRTSIGKINKRFSFSEQDLEDIKKIFSLNFADFSEYWHPVDRAKK